MSTAPRQLGKYTLDTCLGRGGMAEVWKAFDPDLRRYVAIKLLYDNLQIDPEFMIRFVHEAQLIASLRHPNIVQIYDFHVAQPPETERTIAYMVMEYVEGHTLADYIRTTSAAGKFPSAAEIVRLFTPISLAVDYAHEHGMIHRDIKPANILLGMRHTSRFPMGEPILTDFGIAKLLNTATSSGSTMLGTPLYMSPEQVTGSPITERTDMYSLGVVLYELFTGGPPFSGNSPAVVMMQVLNNPPPPPERKNPQVTPAVSEVLMRGLAKDPVNRFPDASTMAIALTEALNMPVPHELQQAITVANSTDMPTYLTPGSQSQPLAVSRSQSQQALPTSDDRSDTGPTREQSSTAAPFAAALEPSVSNTPAISKRVPTSKSVPAPATPTPMPEPEALSRPRSPKRRGLLIALIALLILVLVGSGVGAFYLLHGTGTGTASGAVGQAFFFSSGQVNDTSSQGSNDEFQMNLTGIPNPQAGKSYYAWLLNDASNGEGRPVLLGKLAPANGVVQFSYKGDSQHTNLLENTNSFLITEEPANVTPNIPSLDKGTWRYSATFPNTPAHGQQYGMLDHLRHLLADDPDLMNLKPPLQGGLDIWLLRNTGKIQEWSSSSRDDWDIHSFDAMHKLFVRILDYLDGESLVALDVPLGTQVLVDPRLGQVGLLELNSQQQPPGYLSHVALHLLGVLNAPGSTDGQRTRATQINAALDRITTLLGQIRQDAKQLVVMDNTQLAQPSTVNMLNDMKTKANAAYSGQNDPTTNQLQPGVSQLYVDIQQLATFDVMPYQAQH